MAVNQITYMDGTTEILSMSQGHRLRAELAIDGMGKKVQGVPVSWVSLAAYYAKVKPAHFKLSEFLDWSDTVDMIDVVEDEGPNPTQADLPLDPQ